MFFMCVKYSSCLQQCKKYKNQTTFSRVMITKVLRRFLMNHSVYVLCFTVSGSPQDWQVGGHGQTIRMSESDDNDQFGVC